MSYNYVQNKNARISNRVSRNGKLRTETSRRDDYTTNMSINTDKRNNSTRLFIDMANGESVSLSGHEARTLYRLLQSHYAYSDKSF